MNFLKWFFGWKKKINRNKLTKHFRYFEKYYQEESRGKKAYDSRENFLVQYIMKTKLSPFVGDDNLEEAGKFLVERGIKKFKKKNDINY